MNAHSPLRSASVRAAAALVALVLVVGSCDDRPAPTEPGSLEEASADLPSSETTATPGDALVPLTCEARIGERELTCGPFEPGDDVETAAGAPIIVGEQSSFVELASSEISYDGSAEIFQAEVTVKSLIGQAFGTTDGSSVSGLDVFFHSGPTVTDGSGTVTVANADGTDTFTASNQPFFAYGEILENGQTSSPRSWQWNVPSTVNSFTFEVFVSGEVQYPDGWVEVTPEATGVAQSGSVTLNAQAKDFVGRDVSRTYSWSSSSSTDVSLSSGSGSSVDATGNTSGASETITVTSSGSEADGTATVTVDGSDMAVTELRIGPDPVGVGGSLEWDLTVANHGPTDVTGVTSRISFTGVDVDAETFASSTSGETCSTVTDTGTTLTLDCGMGDITSGSTSSITWIMNPRGSGTITVDASIQSFTGGTDNNAANDSKQRTVTANSGPNLEAGSLSFSANPLATGNTVDIDGSITNTGDGAAGAFDWRIIVNGATVATGSETGLGVGATLTSATVTATGAGPYNDAGGFKAQLVVDPADAVAEESETDNVSDANLVVKGSGYDIQLRYLSDFTSSEKTLFENAVATWESIITGDLSDRTGDLGPASDHPVAHGVDDVVIFVEQKSIDGSSGTLAQAGPRFIRSTGKLTLSGLLRMDSDDFAALKSGGTAQRVIEHEMGHVLGFGSLWDNLSLISGEGTSDPAFTGTQAETEFDAAGGNSCYGTNVPVEDQGGSGTADSHWAEDIFDTERMTGWAESSGTSEPISRITGASMADLGYTVNLSATPIDQTYSVPCSGTQAPPRAAPAEAYEPFDEVLKPTHEVTDDGEVIPIERP